MNWGKDDYIILKFHTFMSKCYNQSEWMNE